MQLYNLFDFHDMQAYPYDAVTPHLIAPPPPPPPPPGTMVPLAPPQMQLLPQPILLPPGTTMYSQPQGFGQVFAQPMPYHQNPAGLQHHNVARGVPSHRQMPTMTQDPSQTSSSSQHSHGGPGKQNLAQNVSPGPSHTKQSQSDSFDKMGQKVPQARLQTSQLSLPSLPPLPPPPPPPPPIPGVTPETPPPASSSPSAENNRQQSQKRAYSGPPQPWSFNSQKQAPSGLQGPWKNPQDAPAEEDEKLSPLKRPLEEPSLEKAVTGNPSNQRPSIPGFTNAPTVCRDTYVDPKEPGLPKELTAQFEALYCKLCSATLSSNVQAKLHYTGKPHQKKVRAYLVNWAQKTGQPLPKRTKVETSKEPVNPEDLYCSICDVNFSSLKHGEQHKMGKAHRKALKRGYTSKKPKKVEVPVDPSGRFGIGSSFLPPSQDIQEDTKAEQISHRTPNVPPPPTHKFYCELCHIGTTSQEHLDTHIGGTKHRKALAAAAKAGIQPLQQTNIPPPAAPADSILASVMRPKDGGTAIKGSTSDLSIYRTPSERNSLKSSRTALRPFLISRQFYCSPCNLTVNSEKTFLEHTDSKKHKHRVASLKKPMSGPAVNH